MESQQNKDYPPRTPPPETSELLLNASTIEVIRAVSSGRAPRCALFDFDGTLSLIREGWLEVMIVMMVEVLQQTGTQETEADLTRLTTEFVKGTNRTTDDLPDDQPGGRGGGSRHQASGSTNLQEGIPGASDAEDSGSKREPTQRSSGTRGNARSICAGGPWRV